MSPTPCRECGTDVPAGSHACPKCGAAVAPVPVAAPRPLPPRPPAQPERPRWRSAVDWGILVAVCLVVGTFFFRLSRDADRAGTEKKEVAREREHLLAVSAWTQDTSSTRPPPESAGRPVPTSAAAKRMWVLGRMVVDGSVWRQEIMKRHGVKGDNPPAAWTTSEYLGNARAYPEVARYVEGRVAAIAEIEKTAAAWTEERVSALARESGMPAAEIRAIFPSDYVREAPGEARLADALLAMHRHMVRVDPRVHHAGGNELRWQSEDDLRRFQDLLTKLNDAVTTAAQARNAKTAAEAAAISRLIR